MLHKAADEGLTDTVGTGDAWPRTVELEHSYEVMQRTAIGLGTSYQCIQLL